MNYHKSYTLTFVRREETDKEGAEKVPMLGTNRGLF